MIFVTVGTQLPFDRLVRTVDTWATECGRNDIVAQTGPSKYVPKTLINSPFMKPATFDRHLSEADIIIAHAGMGSIIGALSMAKPIIVMPRQVALGEHRNDHQLATAERFRSRPGVYVVHDADALRSILSRLLELTGGAPIPTIASQELLQALRDFIADS
ncbi:MAG: glycosyltransferase [Parvibaculum sp.]|uniref:glycosyltransferase n=1 Tax=Parvibaculum sp. TaxID=2024848 RepID=UPI0028505B06|nr:glycosyltransferase [Parvibaculum sp.]MDR3499407.1 glycosyltransferase [Parvibaculum sp.]